MRKIDSKAYDKKYFLSAVEGYKNYNNFTNKINPKYQKALDLAGLKKEDTILDFGCGRGEVVFYSKLIFGCKSTGIDYSKDAINICEKTKIKNFIKEDNSINFIHVDSNTLPFKDSCFDVIFFLDVWEHIYPEQIDLLLKEFNRVLKKNGRLIIHTAPNKVFFDVGFPKYTYYINYLLNRFVYMPIFKKTMARSSINPRSKYEKKFHINEQTKQSLKIKVQEFGFVGDTFIDDFFVMFSSPIYLFYYLIAQPFYIPFLTNIFGEHIWSCQKKV